jgi:ferredoxin-NADP reductase
VQETARCTSIVLQAPRWAGHRAGQHVDIRLTAQDSYQAQRSYSIASAPEDEQLVLTVERLDDGEVSPYLVGELRAGDELELRGPIGGYFVWEARLGGPLLMLAGGSGVVPFRSMLRHRQGAGSDAPARLLYSSRAPEDVIYRDELDALSADAMGIDVRYALTRAWPQDFSGHRGRIDGSYLNEMAWAPDEGPLIYICGPNGFVESAAAALVASGHPARTIKTERFGPS